MNISTKLDKNIFKTLNSFMRMTHVKPKLQYTHINWSPGTLYPRLYVNSDNLDLFMDLYKKAFIKGQRLHFLEMPRHIRPILIDLDFEQDTPNRLYDSQSIVGFLNILVNYLAEYVNAPGDHVCYVLEKEKPRFDKKKDKYKDGIHIIIPSIVVAAHIQLDIRKRFIEDHPKFFETVGITKDITEIYDECVLTRNNWLMYGSCKLTDTMVWKLTSEYAFQLQENNDTNKTKIDVVPIDSHDPNDPRLCDILALRNKLSQTPSTEKGENVIEAGCEESARKTREKRAQIEAKTAANKAKTNEEAIGVRAKTHVAKLVSMLSVKRATDYYTWMCVGWCLHNLSDEFLPLWIEFSKKSPRKFDKGDCETRWLKMDAFQHKFTMSSLYYWAKEDSPKEYYLAFCYKKSIAKRLYQEMKPTNVTCDKITYDDNRVQPLPFNDYDVIMLQSKLGTGKTYQTAQAILHYKFKRILVISPRISYTLALKERYNSYGIPMETYITLLERSKEEMSELVKGAGIRCDSEFIELRNLDEIGMLIISPESLHRIKNTYYDLVIFDEGEANMQQFSSKKTQKDNQMVNYDRLYMIIKNAKKVIICDGAVSSRTYELMENIFTCSPKKLAYIENKAVILKRTLKILKPDRENEDGDEEYELADYKNHYIDLVIKDLKAGIKLVVVTSQRTFGEVLYNAICNQIDNIKCKYYHGEMDDMEKRELADVNTYWAGLDCLIYSPICTVGISFDHVHYDRLYVWGSCKTISGRTMTQCIHRVRHLKEDQVIMFIDNIPVRKGIMERAEWINHMKHKREEIRKLYTIYKKGLPIDVNYSYELRKDESLSNEDKWLLWNQYLDEMNQCPEIDPPAYIFNNELYNNWEADVHHIHYETTLKLYMEEEGYEIEYVPLFIDPEGKKRATKYLYTINDAYLYENIRDLDKNEYERLMGFQQTQRATAVEKKECNKYAFQHFVMAGFQHDLSQDDMAMIYNYIAKNGNKMVFISNAIAQLLNSQTLVNKKEELMKKLSNAATVLDFVPINTIIVDNITRLCDIMGLANCIDIKSSIHRKNIDDNFNEVSDLVRGSLLLQGQNFLEADRDKWRQYKYVSEKLSTLFNHFCGLQIKRIERRGVNKAAVLSMLFCKNEDMMTIFHTISTKCT